MIRFRRQIIKWVQEWLWWFLTPVTEPLRCDYVIFIKISPSSELSGHHLKFLLYAVRVIKIFLCFFSLPRYTSVRTRIPCISQYLRVFDVRKIVYFGKLVIRASVIPLFAILSDLGYAAIKDIISFVWLWALLNFLWICSRVSDLGLAQITLTDKSIVKFLDCLVLKVNPLIARSKLTRREDLDFISLTGLSQVEVWAVCWGLIRDVWWHECTLFSRDCIANAGIQRREGSWVVVMNLRLYAIRSALVLASLAVSFVH